MCLRDFARSNHKPCQAANPEKGPVLCPLQCGPGASGPWGCRRMPTTVPVAPKLGSDPQPRPAAPELPVLMPSDEEFSAIPQGRLPLLLLSVDLGICCARRRNRSEATTASILLSEWRRLIDAFAEGCPPWLSWRCCGDCVPPRKCSEGFGLVVVRVWLQTLPGSSLRLVVKESTDLNPGACLALLLLDSFLGTTKQPSLPTRFRQLPRCQENRGSRLRLSH